MATGDVIPATSDATAANVIVRGAAGGALTAVNAAGAAADTGDNNLTVVTTNGVTTITIGGANLNEASNFFAAGNAIPQFIRVGDIVALTVTTAGNTGNLAGDFTGLTINGVQEAAAGAGGAASALLVGTTVTGQVSAVTARTGATANVDLVLTLSGSLTNGTQRLDQAIAATGAGGAQSAIFTLSRLNRTTITEARTSQKVEKINVYSFALKPEEHQPSGTCNFSRIDTAHLVFAGAVAANTNANPSHIYAVNYNVLRIMSGMGGLAYSN